MVLTPGDDDDGRRLDRILRKHLPDLPLSAIHRILRTGKVKMDGQKAKADTRCRAGVDIIIPDQTLKAGSGKTFPHGEAESAVNCCPPDVLFENGHLLIVNKKAGDLTHGENSLETAVRAYLLPVLKPSLSFTPGPLHRLDRGTSGLIAFSKSIEGARRFSQAIAERKIAKRYLAIICGAVTEAEYWEDHLERNSEEGTSSVVETENSGKTKKALTRVFPLLSDGKTSLALIELGTGRTHQIRAQAASRGKALLGDVKYGGKPLSGGFLLHACQMEDLSDPPMTEIMPRILAAPLPVRFITFIRQHYDPHFSENTALHTPFFNIPGDIME